jgi:hypothetical protein
MLWRIGVLAGRPDDQRTAVDGTDRDRGSPLGRPDLLPAQDHEADANSSTKQQWCEAHGDVVSPKCGLVML